MKTQITLLLFALVILWGCEEKFEIPLNEEETAIVDYFNEIALGFEFQEASLITRKWTLNMQVFVHGNPSQEVLDELDGILTEINALATDGFAISIVDNESYANFHIYFVGQEEYAAAYPETADLLDDNPGLFTVDWSQNTNDLNWGIMYVDVVRLTELEGQKHFLRKALTQSLGFGMTSELYAESIFYHTGPSTVAFSDIDKELIRFLYHPTMTSGLSREAATQRISSIIVDER